VVMFPLIMKHKLLSIGILLPLLCFLVAQVVSVYGTLSILSSGWEADDVDDISLEDIVSVDPFLLSSETGQKLQLDLPSTPLSQGEIGNTAPCFSKIGLEQLSGRQFHVVHAPLWLLNSRLLI
jgi:hypothetical protein